MRHILIKFSVMAFAIFFIAACSSPEKQAKKVIEQHIFAEIFEDHDAYADTLVAEDRKVYESIEREEEPFDMDAVLDALKSGLSDKISVAVDSHEMDGETMHVSTTLTLPDEAKLDELFMAAFADIDPPDDADGDEIGRLLAEAIRGVFKDSEVPTVEESEEFTLKKEDGKWLVYVNLAIQQGVTDGVDEVEDLARNGNIDEAYARLDELRQEFSDLDDEELQREIDRVYAYVLISEIWGWAFETDKDEEKLERYKKIVDLEPDSDWAITAEEAQEEIAELEEKIAEQEALVAYREQVALNNLEVETQFMNMIKGEFENEGDRTLDSVTLAYVLLDDEGNELRSDTHRALMGFGDEDRAMKPGHQSSFTIHVTNAPSAWTDQVEVRVSEVKFLN